MERSLGAYLADHSSFWIPPDFWDADDLALEMTDTPNFWTDGGREDCPVGGFEVAGAGVYLLPQRRLCAVLSGVWRRSMVMPGWSVAVLLCLSWPASVCSAC